jgi:hypothetical protein
MVEQVGVLDVFRDGGPVMLLLLGLALALMPGVGFAAVAAVVAWFMPAMRWVAWVLGALSGVGAALAGVLGAAGWWWGRAQTDAAIVNASPEFAEALRAAGYAAASYNLWAGLLIMAVFGAGSLTAIGLAAAAPRRA